MSHAHPIIKFPKENPIRFVEEQQGIYFSKSFNTKLYQDCKPYQKFDMRQAWVDVLAFQVKIEDSDPSLWYYEHHLTLDFYDITETKYSPTNTKSLIATVFPHSGASTTYYSVYDIRTAFQIGGNNMPTGIYRAKLTVNIDDDQSADLSESIYWSEPLLIEDSSERPDLFENTLYIKYWHDDNNKGMIFTKPLTPFTKFYYYLRIDGGWQIEEEQFGSDTTIYKNQPRNITILNSIPFSTKKILFGDGGGLPPWMVDVLNRIFSCNYIFIRNITDSFDNIGKQYIRKEGAGMDINKEKWYPMLGASIEVEDAEADHDNTIDYLTW